MGLCAGWAGNWLVGFGANQYLYKPSRPLDRYGVGFYALFQSDEAQPTFIDLIEDEWGMEVLYNIALTPWLQFSPSVQYIDSGQVDVDHSVVVTTRLQLYF
jgi:carbohydrate-selective porin OprB